MMDAYKIARMFDLMRIKNPSEDQDKEARALWNQYNDEESEDYAATYSERGNDI